MPSCSPSPTPIPQRSGPDDRVRPFLERGPTGGELADPVDRLCGLLGGGQGEGPGGPAGAPETCLSPAKPMLSACRAATDNPRSDIAPTMSGTRRCTGGG